jgi:HNH endonuclease
MSTCIYCRSELSEDVSLEHVIPQSFGVFKPDLTLTCVCNECNHYFGRELEWRMRVESIEGAVRLQYGLKGAVGGVGTKGVLPVVAEGDEKDARIAIRTNKDGKQETELLAQVGARRNASEPYEWVLEHELSVEFAERYPKGSEYRIIGGRTYEDVDRLVKKLIEVCPTFIEHGKLNSPVTENDQIMLHIEGQMTRAVARCLCKIAFNYMALICGERFAISREFDSLRAFIRFDVGEATDRVFQKQKPIIAQEIITGERGTDGHVLTIDGRPAERTLEVQLALFNTIPYRIPMTVDYTGHRYGKGHHFNLHTWEVSELQLMYAGPNFDPSKLTW